MELPPELRLLDSSERSVPSDLPMKYNWTEHLVPIIRNQGRMSVCWAFTACTAYEYMLAIKFPSQGYHLYSAQQLVDCVDQEPKKVDACGGYLSSNNRAFNWMIQHGIALDKDYPFTGKRSKCRCSAQLNIGPPPLSVEKISDSDGQELIRKLYEHPIAAAIRVAPRLREFKNETYHGPTPEEFREKIVYMHAVTLIGYGADPQTSEDIFLYQNSWGNDWGICGIGKVARDVVTRCSYPVFSPSQN